MKKLFSLLIASVVMLCAANTKADTVTVPLKMYAGNVDISANLILTMTSIDGGVHFNLQNTGDVGKFQSLHFSDQSKNYFSAIKDIKLDSDSEGNQVALTLDGWGIDKQPASNNILENLSWDMVFQKGWTWDAYLKDVIGQINGKEIKTEGPVVWGDWGDEYIVSEKTLDNGIVETTWGRDRTGSQTVTTETIYSTGADFLIAGKPDNGLHIGALDSNGASSKFQLTGDIVLTSKSEIEVKETDSRTVQNEIPVTPEPATMLILGLGALGAGVCGRRFRKS